MQHQTGQGPACPAAGGLSPYGAAVLALAMARRPLRIAVVGANDGQTNDPIFPVIQRHLADRSELTLVEPQAALIAPLEANYGFHPDVKVLNCAVGAGDSLTLHAVRPEFWARAQPGYARGWPVWRAPTGVTSGDRALVLGWVRQVIPDLDDPEAAVETIQVPCSSLPRVLATAGRGARIDVLQVDAEGADDRVLEACALDRTAPAIVHFESVHLPADRLAGLMARLSALGYATFPMGENTLALRFRGSLPGFQDRRRLPFPGS